MLSMMTKSSDRQNQIQQDLERRFTAKCAQFESIQSFAAAATIAAEQVFDQVVAEAKQAYNADFNEHEFDFFGVERDDVSE